MSEIIKKESNWRKRPHRCAECQILTYNKLNFYEKGKMICSITLCSYCKNDKKIVEKWFNRFRKIKN